MELVQGPTRALVIKRKGLVGSSLKSKRAELTMGIFTRGYNVRENEVISEYALYNRLIHHHEYTINTGN